MLRQRFLTAIVLVPLVLFAIYYANSWIFTTLVLILMLACAQEWLSLIPVKNLGLKLIFIAAVLTMTWLTHFYYIYWLMAGMFLWGLNIIAILYYPKSQGIWGYPWIVFLTGLLVLPLFAQSMLQVFQQDLGKDLIVYLLFLVWASDIGAYFAGKQWGRHKLIPLVSPGKTFEGATGGFIFSMLVALAGNYFFQPVHPLRWFLIAILTALISVFGDLFISMLKRRSKIKDTGNLLPGHGGALDRLDSLIAALPLFNCGLIFLAPGL
ncbi:MAG: phosphatidate cytidylyltransferase [Tatlockia sp.]|nr:phosphatidate cytidylyltransferase [Tatlockia sp.]